jgi:hypothetical protein
MRVLRVTAVLAIFALLPGPSSWAQSAAASILGQVTDAQGAALPGTKITVRNAATQIGYNTVTDSEGNYRVLALPIGNYSVTAEHEGFATLVTEPRALQINQQERIDLHLFGGRSIGDGRCQRSRKQCGDRESHAGPVCDGAANREPSIEWAQCSDLGTLAARGHRR